MNHKLNENNSTSYILSNIGRFFELGDHEKKLLRTLERRYSSVANKSILWYAETRIDQLYVIESGWACTYRDNIDGMRQIQDILIPGDIVGLRDFTFKKHSTEAIMITPGTVSNFPFQAIADIVQASPRLSIAFFASIARQEALLTERMMLNLHRTARSRISHFILETYTRLSRLNSVDLGYFYLPLSQQMLGEILGLTNVHVNRVFMALESEGVLRKHRNFIEIFNEKQLYEMANFNSDYLSDELDGLTEYLEPQTSES